MTIFFYTKTDKFGEFSNFAKFGIEMDGVWWPTVEHYFQAQKFLDKNHREKIRTANTAKIAAELGRSRQIPIRSDWEEVKDGIMYAAVLKKFNTYPELAKLLKSTGSENIVENAPSDYYWGCGQDGTGQNKLGMMLCQVRERLLMGVQ